MIDRDTLPWHRAMSVVETCHCVTSYTFGPLVKIVERKAGRVQVRTHYYDHDGNYFKTEKKLIKHMNRLAEKE